MLHPGALDPWKYYLYGWMVAAWLVFKNG